METDKNNNMEIYLFIGFCLTYLWLLVPQGQAIKPFLFSNQELSKQAYADYLCTRLFFLTLIWMLHKSGAIPGIIVILFALYILDFMVNYNNPYGFISKSGFTINKPTGFSVPLSFPLLIALVLGVNALWKI